MKPFPNLKIKSFERDLLRKLAAEIRELSERQIEKEKRDMWYAHNSLQDAKTPVFCSPENGWNEIILQEHLLCQTPIAREWEWNMRQEIFWAKNMGDDKVCDGEFIISLCYESSGWGLSDKKIGGENGGSYTWESPLSDYSLMSRLRHPKIFVDKNLTDAKYNLAVETFGDILKVRVKSNFWWSLGMTWTAVRLRGLERFMMDMVEYPTQLHSFMSFLMNGYMAMLDYLEEQGLLSLNNDNSYVGSGGFGFTRELPQPDFNGKVRCKDMWGFAESQETCCVSPEMFEEYIFQYQLPILKRFGLNCYGCCEPLDNRWHIVKNIPNLRRVSVSPWSDLKKMAENLQDKYIFSYKPNPADISAAPINKERIRKQLREAVEITRGCRLEIIMKDNHTIGNDPQNVIEWCRIAQEEVMRK